MANTKCEGCGEQHNARKAADGERLVARRVELVSNGQTCAEVSRGSDGQARAALRASEGRACKRAVQKGWCALDEGKQKQAAATAAVQRLADTPRKLLHTPTKNTFFCILHQTRMVVKLGRLRVDPNCVCLGGQ